MDLRENRKAGDTKDSVGCAVESDTGRQSVDRESLVQKRKMPTADEVDNLSQRRMEKSEECGSWEADPGTGHMKMNAMNYAKIVKIHVTGSVTYVKIDVTGSLKFSKMVMTASSRVRSERRANVWRRQMGRRMRSEQQI